MTKYYRIVISDMISAIDTIGTYISGIDEVAFSQNKLVQDGVLLQLALIGEAARKLPTDIRPLAPDIPWNAVIGFRNIVIHEYANVSLGTAWRIAKTKLSTLRDSLVALKSKIPNVSQPQ